MGRKANIPRSKPNKTWVNKDGEFYKRPMTSWLQDKYNENHSAQNEGKSVITERFIWLLTNKIDKHMTSIWKNVDINKSDDIVHKYNIIISKNS